MYMYMYMNASLSLCLSIYIYIYISCFFKGLDGDKVAARPAGDDPEKGLRSTARMQCAIHSCVIRSTWASGSYSQSPLGPSDHQAAMKNPITKHYTLIGDYSACQSGKRPFTTILFAGSCKCPWNSGTVAH